LMRNILWHFVVDMSLIITHFLILIYTGHMMVLKRS
jgi:hypothetical protein